MQLKEDASLNKLLGWIFCSNLQLSTSLLGFAWSGPDKDYSLRWEKNKGNNLIRINWPLKHPGVGKRGRDVKNVKFRKQSLVRNFETSKWYLNKGTLWYYCHAMNTSLSACWHVNHWQEGSNASNSFYNVNPPLLYIRTSETPNSSELLSFPLLCHQTAGLSISLMLERTLKCIFFPKSTLLGNKFLDPTKIFLQINLFFTVWIVGGGQSCPEFTSLVLLPFTCSI